MGSAIIQNVSGSVCGNQFVTLWYLVCSIFNIWFRSIALQTWSVLVIVGTFSVRTTSVADYPVNDKGLILGIILSWWSNAGNGISSNWGAGGFSRGWNGLMSAECTDTYRVSFVRRTRYTAGESWEHKIYGPRHGSNNFGFGPSVSWKSLYTSTFCPGLNTGYGASLSLSPACLVARAVKLRRANSSAIYKLPRVSCANTSVSAVLPSWGIPSIIPTGNIAFLPNV